MDSAEFLELVASDQLSEVRYALARSPSLVNQRAWNTGTTALLCACHRGFTKMVSLLLESGADIHARERASGATPLHWAAEAGHPEIIRMLLERGADLEPIESWYELTPLGWAAVIEWEDEFHDDKTAAASLLLDAGARLDIFSAIALRKEYSVEKIVVSDTTALERPLGFAGWGMRPLHFAVHRQFADMVKVLLDLGADVGSRMSTGMTPLILATVKGDIPIGYLLIDDGARDDVSAAVIREDPNALGDTIEMRLLNQLLFLSAQFDKAAIISHLVRRGADPNTRAKLLICEGPAMATPLHVASSKGHAAVATALLEAGADVNPAGEDGTPTPLHLAAGEGHLEVVHALLLAGANISVRDSVFDATPMEWAECENHSEIVELLRRML